MLSEVGKLVGALGSAIGIYEGGLADHLSSNGAYERLTIPYLYLRKIFTSRVYKQSLQTHLLLLGLWPALLLLTAQ